MHKLALPVALTLALAACGKDEAQNYDQSLLDSYRRALPSNQQLEAKSPDNPGAAVGDPAAYPNHSKEMVLGINGAVRGIVDIMRAIVELPPTIYNSETKEFVWGPFPNEQGFGFIAAYIRENPEGDDFAYGYALLRGVDNDVAKLRPVIWGGANPNPDNEDWGNGVTLWDFEADHAFAAEFDPDYATRTFTRGRFAALYGAGPDQDTPGAEVGIVLAYFRNFADEVPGGQTPSQTGDLDYFYGRYVFPDQNRVDWVDYLLDADLDDNGVEDGPELVSVNMAFLNGGLGRAEATASGGELPTGQSLVASECWDDTISRTFLEGILYDGPNQQGVAWIEGDENSCGTLFESGLDALGLPGLSDVDGELKDALTNVAENGVPTDA